MVRIAAELHRARSARVPGRPSSRPRVSPADTWDCRVLQQRWWTGPSHANVVAAGYRENGFDRVRGGPLRLLNQLENSSAILTVKHSEWRR
jgi:hypothetical protein